MRKYLAVKNMILTIVVSTMYYKSVFEDVSVFLKFIATLVVFIALMGLLQNADKHFMDTIGYTENKKSA